MAKFHIGDIVRNHYMGDDNPYRNFIYLGVEGKFIKTIQTDGKKIEQGKYYKSIIREFENKFEVIGHSEAMDAMVKELLK
ncbi:hypothetical protein LFYK43_10850 [Ligilactobacillus salitolerans]|uniref:Phage protein n=1 Tax=Ligilactobacillus salitolerans TaxID=1808352 RepID=A0A401ISX5_9LACO|nr:hypothetical protein [Ligilactobacillus salitolerans]GBG94626.1 hypothetical protein LFYK43_10850 [Ligilactobacillus salitolerans]